MDERGNPRPRALVTGASSGLGAAFAEQLAARGNDLILVARRRERLVSLADRLGREHGVVAEVLVADLADPDGLRAVEDRVAVDPGPTLLINNAGFAGYMPFIQLEPDRAEELIDVHVVATTRLTRAALPGMISRHRGAIINVSSLLAYSASMPPSSPLPKRAVYAGCKAYVVTFTETLYHELDGTGVQVQALCPGITRGTELHDHVPGYDLSHVELAAMDAVGVVQASLRGLELGEVVCVPGLDDPGLLDTIRANQRDILARAARAPAAERYTKRR